ncbi:hypothetical protein [Nocardia phage NC1]|nr:hypothetical protein [Nocardia phage NC1]QSL67696.1 hypothetical protein [Nocardia phage P69]
MSHIVDHNYARQFTTTDGRTFGVYYVPADAPTYSASGGDQYRAREATVEFYDATYVDERAANGHPLGQFTGASYYVSTLLASALAGRYDGERTGPFRLHGGVPAWDIDGGTWLDIVAWVAEHGTPTADKARLLEGWPVRSTPHAGKHAARHGEVYGKADAFNGYTTSAGVECGWYAKEGTADCGHRYNNLGEDGRADIGTGYGLTSHTGDASTVCYGCIYRDALARLDELAPGKAKVAGYVSNDGQLLTTWNGYPLASVVSHRVSVNPIGRVHHWVFRRGTRTFFAANGGAGLSAYTSAHSRRPSYVPAGRSPVFTATDVNGVAL